MMNNEKYLVFVKFNDDNIVHDYPQGVPIPRIHETIIFGNHCGVVANISHSVIINGHGEATIEIKIICSVT